ncbi:uncharacterized protein [Rutidosis leptorrhynchoides]|uniref:uncharacterized protein n=1 Tax=Rutidosis leptorrhynchoides TaxID=125765 RepID=UPI003A997411
MDDEFEIAIAEKFNESSEEGMRDDTVGQEKEIGINGLNKTNIKEVDGYESPLNGDEVEAMQRPPTSPSCAQGHQDSALSFYSTTKSENSLHASNTNKSCYICSWGNSSAVKER